VNAPPDDDNCALRLRRLTRRIPEGRNGHCLRLLGALIVVAHLAACGTVPSVPDATAAIPRSSDAVGELDAYRVSATDTAAYDGFLRRWEADMARSGKDGVVALGLSGGGSVGAFGAGVITGWTEAGRPDFNLVTGVSTGAMMAPFAFAGPGWDEALRRAFLDPDIASLTVPGVGIIARPSIYSGIPLSRLVARHATPELLTAIAARHHAGGRLLIATTNIDSLDTVVWNMGSIAVAAQNPAASDAAIRLFRSVIVASASVPGYFPPVALSTGDQQELHVDGAVNAPLILLPEAVATRTISGRLRPLRLYVVVNGQVEPRERRVRGGTMAVIGSSLTSMGRATLRAHLQIISLFARRHDASFRYAYVPRMMDVTPLEFRLPQMQQLFDFGRDAARSGRAFVESDL